MLPAGLISSVLLTSFQTLLFGGTYYSPTFSVALETAQQAESAFQLTEILQPFSTTDRSSEDTATLNSPAEGFCHVPADITSLYLSSDSQYLAIGAHSRNLDRFCAGEGSQLMLRNLQTGQRIAYLIEDGWTYNDPPGTIPLANEVDVVVGERVTGLVFLPESPILVASLADSTVRLWNRETGEAIGEWPGHTMAVWAIAASQDGHTVVTGSADRTIRVRIIHPATGEIVNEQVLPETDLVQHLRLSNDGRTLVSILGSSLGDTTVHLWRQENGTWQRVAWEQVFPWDGPSAINPEIFATEYHPTVAPRIQLSPDGTTVITGHNDGIIRLWNSESGVRRLSLENHQGPIRALAVSPDSQILASNADGVVKLWNLATGQLIRTLETSGQLRFSQDGDSLLVHQTSYQTNQTEIWNWRSSTLLTTLPSNTVTLSTDGNTALSARAKAIEVYRR